MLKIGILGCGKIAQVRHIPELAGHPQAEIAGYYNPTLSRAEEMARKMIADGDIGRVLTFSPSPESPTPSLTPSSPGTEASCQQNVYFLP